MHRSQRAWCR